MNYTMNAKQGDYLGSHYDSQLEGQYARFFHLAFGFSGFRRCTDQDYFGIGENSRYRPDFYLPRVRIYSYPEQIGAYVEIKPKVPDERTEEKMRCLAALRKQCMILCIGSPIDTQINSISGGPSSAWIIGPDGVELRNCHFVQGRDNTGANVNILAPWNAAWLPPINYYTKEAENASRFKFDMNGQASYPDFDDEEIPFYDPKEIPF